MLVSSPLPPINLLASTRWLTRPWNAPINLDTVAFIMFSVANHRHRPSDSMYFTCWDRVKTCNQWLSVTRIEILYNVTRLCEVEPSHPTERKNRSWSLLHVNLRGDDQTTRSEAVERCNSMMLIAYSIRWLIIDYDQRLWRLTFHNSHVLISYSSYVILCAHERPRGGLVLMPSKNLAMGWLGLTRWKLSWTTTS